jgi:hypothetical protein
VCVFARTYWKRERGSGSLKVSDSDIWRQFVDLISSVKPFAFEVGKLNDNDSNSNELFSV